MKTLLLILLLASPCYAVEALVRAKPHWIDSVSTTTLPTSMLDTYQTRLQIGDIMVIRPDGWEWGRAECLPNFIVVKVPSVTMEQAKKYEDILYETVDGFARVKKRRRYRIDPEYVQSLVDSGTGEVTITSLSFGQKILDKTQ